MLDYAHNIKGQLLLKAKGHYPGIHVDKIVRKFCGLPDTYSSGPMHLLSLYMEIAGEVLNGQRMRMLSDSILYRCAMENKKATTYNVSFDDKISIQGLIDMLESHVADCQIKEGDKILIALPKVLEFDEKDIDPSL